MPFMYILFLTITIFFAPSFSLSPIIHQSIEWAACSTLKGVCINTDTYSCSSSTRAGFCPGGANIRCCPFPAGIRSSKCTSDHNGICTRTENCPSSVFRGKCPGPSAVTCCSAATAATTRPPSITTRQSSGGAGVWSACRSRAGVCIDVGKAKCSGATVRGLCPGSSNIRCCPFPAGLLSAKCSTSKGICTRTENCPRSTLRGKCPGPSAVTCCTSGPSGSSGGTTPKPTGCTLGSAGGCSTAVADGLTKQLVAELNRMGIRFSSLSSNSLFRCSAPCVPLLQKAARDSLAATAQSKRDFITLNSAYRSSAQQYLLYQWKQAGKCKIKAVARPGTSNHEGGVGIDVRSFNFWKSALERNSWVWLGRTVKNDPWHFDFKGKGVRNDARRESLRAFQKLWNRNNPRDKIGEDGRYGRETAERLSKAPCDGW